MTALERTFPLEHRACMLVNLGSSLPISYLQTVWPQTNVWISPRLCKLEVIIISHNWKLNRSELSDVQAGFRKGRGTRDQIANIRWIIKKAREFQKNIYFCFIDYAKASDCVDHNKLWKILKEMGIPDHLTCLLRNLYAVQEATVRTRHGTTDWFQTGKGVRQGCDHFPRATSYTLLTLVQSQIPGKIITSRSSSICWSLQCARHCLGP